MIARRRGDVPLEAGGQATGSTGVPVTDGERDAASGSSQAGQAGAGPPRLAV